jgi:hypothetical protein
MMTLASVKPEIPRDHWGRPLIIPIGGGKLTPYTRCTTYVGCLEDTYNLSLWQQRMVIAGLVDRPDLLLSAAAHRDDKGELNKIAELAIEAAKGRAAATVGTALHALTEQVDAGQTVGPIPHEYQRDLDAYVAATRSLRVLHSERFVVNDEYRIGGTPDRVVEYQGRNYIADIKTGTIKYGPGKIAMQLAVYANSDFYDHQTGERTPQPDVDRERGIVIHLPAGTGTCELLWVDIAAGWKAVDLAGMVRVWRSWKGLLTPLDEITTAVANLDSAGLLASTTSTHELFVPDPIVVAINNAVTVDQLTAIWTEHSTAWEVIHTAAATRRKAELLQRSNA